MKLKGPQVGLAIQENNKNDQVYSNINYRGIVGIIMPVHQENSIGYLGKERFNRSGEANI